MKFAKISLSLILAASSFGTANSQLSPTISAEIDALAKPCSDIAGAAAGLPEEQAKSIAIAALPSCYQALSGLDKIEREKLATMSNDDRNYLYYVGGSVIWMTAASESMKNNGMLSNSICQLVKSAETIWGNVIVQPGSEVHNAMLTNQLRNMMLPACIQATQN